MNVPDIDCIELVELTTDYLEGALAPIEVARIDAHLTGCDGCAEYLRQMQTTQASLPGVTPPPLAAPVRAKLLDVFRAWKSGTSG